MFSQTSQQDFSVEKYGEQKEEKALGRWRGSSCSCSSI